MKTSGQSTFCNNHEPETKINFELKNYEHDGYCINSMVKDTNAMKEINSTPSSNEVNKLLAKSECLVLLAHGSRDPQWRVPFERIVDAVQGQSGKTKVRLAYMEFIEPTLMLSLIHI